MVDNKPSMEEVQKVPPATNPQARKEAFKEYAGPVLEMTSADINANMYKAKLAERINTLLVINEAGNESFDIEREMDKVVDFINSVIDALENSHSSIPEIKAKIAALKVNEVEKQNAKSAEAKKSLIREYINALVAAIG